MFGILGNGPISQVVQPNAAKEKLPREWKECTLMPIFENNSDELT